MSDYNKIQYNIIQYLRYQISDRRSQYGVTLHGFQEMFYNRGYSEAVLRAVIKYMNKAFNLKCLRLLRDQSAHMPTPASFSEELTHPLSVTLWEVFHGPVHHD